MKIELFCPKVTREMSLRLREHAHRMQGQLLIFERSVSSHPAISKNYLPSPRWPLGRALRLAILDSASKHEAASRIGMLPANLSRELRRYWEFEAGLEPYPIFPARYVMALSHISGVPAAAISPHFAGSEG